MSRSHHLIPRGFFTLTSLSSSLLRPRLFFSLSMPSHQKKSAAGHQQWKEKPRNNKRSDVTEAKDISDGIANLHIGERNFHSNASSSSNAAIHSISATNQNSKYVWKPKAYSTSAPVVEAATINQATEVDTSSTLAERTPASLLKHYKGLLNANFNVDNLTFSLAQVRASFYPKFENEKSDQEIRTRMIEMVSNGQANLEVSLKHSGSLFMYAGNEGGAYAKNSYGNVYTAVGVFVLGRMFEEAWGNEARKKQKEFNNFIEKNRICISMELVTAVLGDHGQRPLQDYVVVTAVTELGNGKPEFYATPDVIAFCRRWRLPTNNIWLFSTRRSVTSFFAAYDALCEEGTATPVCRALDEVADISVSGSKDHTVVQGEILEGLVARIVSHESSKHMEKVLVEFPSPTLDKDQDVGPSLREICGANRSDEKLQIKALLESVGTSMCPDQSDWLGLGDDNLQSRIADRSVLLKFLQAHPADLSTIKLQEMIRLMKLKHFPVAFKCYHNFQKLNSLSKDNLHFRMVIHVHSDFAFRKYQNEMRQNPGLWPLYRGFFVDVNLFKVNKEKAAEITKESNLLLVKHSGSNAKSMTANGLADEDANLMIKLKFLTYKIRTFLIRNGLSTLFKEGPVAYRNYYLRQMKIWGTSTAKQRELSKMLDEWAVYIRRKCGNKPLSQSMYLTEAEPFLEQYAKRSAENQALIGSAGNLVRSENFVALIEGGRDEEGDINPEVLSSPPNHSPAGADTISKNEGLIVFFPGIPGCAKSALCKEILSSREGLGDDRPVHSLMGDLVKGRYWQKIADERKKKPYSITLADKNAPNEEVWRQIEDMCKTTQASAVPVIPDCEGSDSNPFSLDSLAVFMFRVLQRVNHPGNLDKASPNAGYVLLMFYHLYEGKNRKEFENELVERFGSVVKMPLLKSDRKPIPDPVKGVLDEGISLYKLHTRRHGKTEPTKGSYAKDWIRWEKRLREVLTENAEYLNSIQVPFHSAVKEVLDQLRVVAKGEYRTPTSSEKRKFGNIVFCAVSLPVPEIVGQLEKLAQTDPLAKKFLNGKDLKSSLRRAHLTLAHKRSHGVTAVANYGIHVKKNVPVNLTALLFSDKMAAFEAHPGCVDGDKIQSKNEWPHVTIWTSEGIAPKEANRLPDLLREGTATQIVLEPPITITGVLDFY